MFSSKPALGSRATQPSSDPATPLLEVKELCARFPTEHGMLHALDGVSFELRRGETLGIVGESGSGKSVLARSIMGLLAPHAVTSGRVFFEGLSLREMAPSRARRIWGDRMAMVFQDSTTSLNPVLRIGRQITETVRLHLGLRGRAARQHAVDLLRQVGMTDPERRLRNFPHELSGGMRQRVAIAVAISCSPVLLLADEPTTALDVTVQRQILDLLRSIQLKHGMAMVLITHDMGVVARRTDRVMVMYGGQVVETGTTREVFSSTRHPYTAALLASIPRLEDEVHSRLVALPGRPVQAVDPEPGCRFASRCPHARDRCLSEDPELMSSSGPDHMARCFFPVGTPAGDEARRANLAGGVTAAGLALETGR